MSEQRAKTPPPAGEAPRAYSYLRFSTPEQSKGDSLRRQTALADEYAKRHGLKLDTELSLRDLGVSAFRGANAAVGALGTFLKAIEDGLVPKGSVLLVESLDRVSRQEARKAVRILEEILEAGIDVVTLTDGKRWTVDGLGGIDFLLAILLFMRGAEESATKSKRLRASWVAKRARAAQGEVQTIAVPAWLKAEGSAAKDSRNAKLTLIPERAALVRRIFDMFLEGTGKKKIAETFNREQIPTWGAGKFWHATYIFKILTSPTVTGQLVPHVEHHTSGRRIREAQAPITDYYPRVIDDETFDRAQKLCHPDRPVRMRSGQVASVVAGLARCPQCGSTMTRVSKGSSERAGAPKLVCVKAKAGAGCTYHTVRLVDIERALASNAAYLRTPPIPESTLAADIAATDEELYQVSKEVEELVDAIARKASPALLQGLEDREARAAALGEQLGQLRARAADSESRVVNLRASRMADAIANLREDTVAAANAALRECIESVTVDYPRGVLRLHWRHGPETELPCVSFVDLDKADRTAARRG